MDVRRWRERRSQRRTIRKRISGTGTKRRRPRISKKRARKDRELTRKIRAAITGDKSLSTYAHNIKILAQDGKVTLRGPVRSDEEKAAILSKAVEIAGEGNVTDQTDVAPPKS